MVQKCMPTAVHDNPAWQEYGCAHRGGRQRSSVQECRQKPGLGATLPARCCTSCSTWQAGRMRPWAAILDPSRMRRPKERAGGVLRAGALPRATPPRRPHRHRSSPAGRQRHPRVAGRLGRRRAPPSAALPASAHAQCWAAGLASAWAGKDTSVPPLPAPLLAQSQPRAALEPRPPRSPPNHPTWPFPYVAQLHKHTHTLRWPSPAAHPRPNLHAADDDPHL